MQCHVHLTQGLADEKQDRKFFFILFLSQIEFFKSYFNSVFIAKIEY